MKKSKYFVQDFTGRILYSSVFHTVLSSHSVILKLSEFKRINKFLFPPLNASKHNSFSDDFRGGIEVN